VCATTSVDDLYARLTENIRQEFDADWVAVLHRGDALASAGDDAPNAAVLAALAAGTSASPMVADGHAGPDDLAVAPLAARDAVLLVGREGHPFRRRERQQLLALARVADRVATLLS
jgi:hypothetical protein